MPLTIQGDVSKNDIQVASKYLEACNGIVILHGEGATLRIEEPSVAGSLFCTLAGGASIEAGQNCIFGAMTLHALAPGAKIVIGRDVGFNGAVGIAAHEPSTISVGDRCLFAGGVEVNSSDVHHIYDLATHERINPARDITIEPDVWLAAGCKIMKGAYIRTMSVVGAGAIVSAVFPPNSIIAGVPGRVVREGIYWRR